MKSNAHKIEKCENWAAVVAVRQHLLSRKDVAEAVADTSRKYVVHDGPLTLVA